MLKKEDLKVGMQVKVSDIWDIPGVYIYLGDFRQLPIDAGEGVILAFGENMPKPAGDNIFTFYLPYNEWLEENLNDSEVFLNHKQQEVRFLNFIT